MNGRFSLLQPVFDAFERAGHQLVIVGGAVRDLVMGLPEIGDVDLATDALPDQIRKILEDIGLKTWAVGERFGTITALIGDNPVEITTFRVGEIYTHGSRHPEVRFGQSLEQDLARRDLSINAMAMRADGTIVDPFDGQGAIRERKLEVPGGGYENTLSILRDDPLRILRIARFAARLGFRPTTGTTDATRESAGELVHISRERWKMELDKLLLAPDLGTGLHWLHETGTLSVILPETHILDRDDIGALTRVLLRAAPKSTLRWALLLAWVALKQPLPQSYEEQRTRLQELRSQAGRLADELRFSRKEHAQLLACFNFWPPSSSSPPPSPTHGLELPVQELWLGERQNWLELAMALTDDPEERHRLGDLLEHDRRFAIRHLEATEFPPLPPQFGRTLHQRLGLSGPAIGEAIRSLDKAIYHGHFAPDADEDEFVAWLASNPSTDS